MNRVLDVVNELVEPVACLGCDEVKKETLMMLCGHAICRQCLERYSSSKHPKSSIRCEVCNLETKVHFLVYSIPQRQVSEIYLKIVNTVAREFGSSMGHKLLQIRQKDSTEQ